MDCPYFLKCVHIANGIPGHNDQRRLEKYDFGLGEFILRSIFSCELTPDQAKNVYERIRSETEKTNSCMPVWKYRQIVSEERNKKESTPGF